MPSLKPQQVAVASERTKLARSAEEARARQYADVARSSGVDPHTVQVVLEMWTDRFGKPSTEPEEKVKPGPPVPTLDTALIREGKIKTIALHLVAIEALVRLLDAETAERASEALQATKEALGRWKEVQNGE